MEMKKYKLSEIASFIGSGMTPLRSNEKYWNSKDYPWLKTEQLGEYQIFDTNEYISKVALEETNLKLFPKNTLSVAMYGEGKTRGNVSILAEQMTTNQACCNIIVNNKLANYKYVYYWLKNSYYKLRSLSSGIRNNLNSEDIKKFEINLPPLPTQQKIAAVLSSLDDKIALNKKINAKLEAMAKRLYDYWFVQFDYPDKNGKPYKTSGGKMVWNEVLKREIPEGWEVKSINDISVSYRGVGYTAKDEKTEKDKNIILILRGNNISNNHIIYNGNTVYVDKSFVLKEQEIKKFDIIITMSSGSKEHVGKSAMFLFDSAHSYGAFCNKITPNKECQYFLENYLHSESFIKYIRHSCSGTGINNLTNEHFDNAKFSFPTESNLQLFNKKMKSIYDERAVVEKEIQKLTNLRDRLLPLLMNGQVEVGTNNSSEFCNAKLGKQATACDMNGQVEVEG